jgi:hypothetical protein
MRRIDSPNIDEELRYILQETITLLLRLREKAFKLVKVLHILNYKDL